MSVQCVENNVFPRYSFRMTITQLDFSVLDWIQRTLGNPVADTIFPFITRLGDGGLIWILLALTLIILPRTRKTGIILAVSIASAAVVCLIIIKPLAARARPFVQNPGFQLLIPPPYGFSFPSGHAASSFAAASALFFRKSRLFVPAAVLAFLIAFSRLYVYVHFPTDVLAGMLIGLAAGASVCRIDRKIQKDKKND